MQYETLLAGAYQIEKTLDRSTYSVLCSGKQPTSGQAVRLRFWLTAHATSSEEQQYIRAEATAIQAIEHPHLLPILEVRATEQGVLLVSASAQGGSLNARLSQQILKPLPLAEALDIVNQVGQALHALHEQGITHGNLTPLAIFFTQPDQVCLGEFYLRSIQRSIQGYQPLLDENIPRCWYMAPEQFDGRLNARTDQYALGCLTYVLLTGRVPFAGSARATLLQKHQREQPRPLSVLNAEVPAQVEEAVLKALAKTPEARHSSVLAFLNALGVSAETANLSVAARAEHATRGDLPLYPVAAQKGCEAGVTQPATDAKPDASLEKPLEPATIQAFADLETLKQPALDAASTQTGMALVESKPLPQPVLPLSARGFSPIARGTSKVPRPSIARLSRAQGLTVLAPMIALVLVIVLVLSGWLVLAGGRTPLSQAAGGTTPGATQRTSATATSTGSSQPTATATVNVIGLRYPTPTPQPAPQPSPTSRPPTPNAAAVTPLLNCIQPDTVNGGFLAHFGYTNSNSSTVNIPVGSSNWLVSSSTFLNGLQPTSFAPGTQNNVFQVHFSRRSFVSWFLNGNQAMATGSSPQC